MAFLAVDENQTSRRPQVLVLGSITRVPFWVPIFEPLPYSFGVHTILDNCSCPVDSAPFSTLF